MLYIHCHNIVHIHTITVSGPQIFGHCTLTVRFAVLLKDGMPEWLYQINTVEDILVITRV